MVLFFDKGGAIHDCIPEGLSADVLASVQSAEAASNAMLQATIGNKEFEKLVVPNSCSFSIEDTSVGQMVAIRLPNQADIMPSGHCNRMLTRLQRELGNIISTKP